MPAPRAPVTTVDEYFALPEDSSIHDELLDGVYVVTPQPSRRHEMVVSSLFAILHSGLGLTREFFLFCSHGAVVLGPRSVAEPDLFVAPRAPSDAQWRDTELAVLVVEVLSPGTARYDRGIKRQLYQEAGIPEYWIVDSYRCSLPTCSTEAPSHHPTFLYPQYLHRYAPATFTTSPSAFTPSLFSAIRAYASTWAW